MDKNGGFPMKFHQPLEAEVLAQPKALGPATWRRVMPVIYSHGSNILWPAKWGSIFHIILVGGLEHGFYDFPILSIYWECHHPN